MNNLTTYLINLPGVILQAQDSSIFSNLRDNLLGDQIGNGPIWSFLSIISIFLAIIFLLIGIFKIVQLSKTQAAPPKAVGTTFFAFLISIIFISLETVFFTINDTLYSEGSIIAYDNLNISLEPGYADVFKTIFIILQVLGVIAFMTGWFSLYSDYSRNQPIAKAAWAIIGGALLINFPAFIRTLGDTLGLQTI